MGWIASFAASLLARIFSAWFAENSVEADARAAGASDARAKGLEAAEADERRARQAGDADTPLTPADLQFQRKD